MLQFLLLFILIYGGMNFYACWKLGHLLRGHTAALVALGLFGALMTSGPILVRTLEGAEWIRTAHGFALVAYLWMAAVLWFLFLAGAADLWNFAIAAARHPWPGAARLALPLRPTLAVIGVLIASGLAWGAVEARRPRLERLTICTPRLAPGPPLRILQIADVHLGLLERGARLDQIRRTAQATQPDLIVSSGDLLDGMGDHLNHLHEQLAAIRPRLGKFAVTGNHEFYVGIATSVAFHEASGFRLLRGEAVTIDGGRLRLAGVDDPSLRLGGSVPANEPALLGPRQGAPFTILLKHQPRIEPAALGRFDLMLSGHTHQGQIVPFGLIVSLFFPYLSGTHALGDGSTLHVSRGTGTWGPPLRLGAPPEVTLITIEHKEG